MTLRHLIVALLAVLLACPPPAMAGRAVIGFAGPSAKAIIGGIPLQQGTNVSSGDVIEVAAGGEGVVTFGHNAMARFAAESAVRASRDTTTIGLELLRGAMTYRSTPDQPVVASFVDALVRSEGGKEAVAIVAFRNPALVSITAERGALEVTAGRDHRSVIVPQGQTVEVALVDDTAQNTGNPPPPQSPDDTSNKKKKRGAAAWITGGVLAGGAAIGGGIALSYNQTQLSCQQKGALVSPYAFPCP
jgi:hypothetical protein